MITRSILFVHYLLYNHPDTLTGQEILGVSLFRLLLLATLSPTELGYDPNDSEELGKLASCCHDLLSLSEFNRTCTTTSLQFLRLGDAGR